MTSAPLKVVELVATRTRLISDIRAKLDANAERFLLSLHDAAPDFSVIGLPQAAELPAVRWKLQNLERLIEQDPGKHADQREALQRLLQDGRTA